MSLLHTTIKFTPSVQLLHECFNIQINARQLCFWDEPKTCRELVLAHERKSYPPRFTLQVLLSRNSAKLVIVKVDFKGTKEDLSQEILLNLPGRCITIKYSLLHYLAATHISKFIDTNSDFIFTASAGSVVSMILVCRFVTHIWNIPDYIIIFFIQGGE